MEIDLSSHVLKGKKRVDPEWDCITPMQFLNANPKERCKCGNIASQTIVAEHAIAHFCEDCIANNRSTRKKNHEMVRLL